MWKKLEPLCTVGGNIKWYSHYGRRYLKELQKELSHEIAISLLGIYPKEPDNKFLKRYLHSHINIAASVTMTQSQLIVGNSLILMCP